MPGMLMSSSTTSGRRSAARSTVSPAFGASPIISISGSADSNVLIPCRNRVWSSVRKTRILAMIVLLGRGCMHNRWPPERQPHDDCRPGAGLAPDFEAAAHQAYAFAHSRQTERVLFCHRDIQVKPDAVVFYSQSQNRIGGSQGNLYSGCPRMACNIVVALLHQPVD